MQCKDIAEFNNSDECLESKKMGVYDEVTKHFHGKKKLYTDDDLYFIASFYEYRKQFRNKHRTRARGERSAGYIDHQNR